jgi:FAD/FMN-containing dehydrogenase
VWVSLFDYPENPLMRVLPDLLVRHGARPHWGKCLFTDTAHLPALYPGWDDFCRLRETLDPEGRFLNAFSARLVIGVAG